jgi:Glycosyl transferase family 21
MHLWNNFSIIPGAGTAAVNNHRSNNSYLVGSFFMIHRSGLENKEGFRAIREAVHEDVVLGMLIKKASYNVRIVKLDVLLTALWSRDLPALCHGIGRTLAPMNRFHKVTNFPTMFFMALLPYVLL